MMGALVIALLICRRKFRFAHATVAFLAVACAIPGVLLWVTQREDSPLHVAASTQKLAHFSTQLESFADEHRCAAVQENTCPSCDPVVYFSWATMAGCARPAPVTLHTDALRTGCIEGSDSLVCGPRQALP